MSTSPLLINEHPLMVLPGLAAPPANTVCGIAAAEVDE